MCDHASCLKRAGCAPGRCGMHLWSQERSTSQKANLFEYSKPVTSIDQFWSHSWHGRQRWKVWCLLLLAHVCFDLIYFAQFVLAASCSDSLAFCQLLDCWRVICVIWIFLFLLHHEREILDHSLLPTMIRPIRKGAAMCSHWQKASDQGTSRMHGQRFLLAPRLPPWWLCSLLLNCFRAGSRPRTMRHRSLMHPSWTVLFFWHLLGLLVCVVNQVVQVVHWASVCVCVCSV